jgi:hypothetical protein
MRRPSPALLVAMIALVVACAGSATAASLITSADIKNRSIRGRDIRSETITSRNVKKLSGRDVIRNGLDGSDINENTLDPVPNATNAQVAQAAATADQLSHARVLRLAFRQGPAPGPTVLYDEGGLRITAQCPGAGRMTARAAPTLPGVLRLAITHPGSPARTTLLTDDDFHANDSANLLSGGSDDISGTLTYFTTDGQVTTIQYLTQVGGNCTLTGNAVHTTP